jgi:hypothetical protein
VLCAISPPCARRLFENSPRSKRDSISCNRVSAGRLCSETYGSISSCPRCSRGSRRPRTLITGPQDEELTLELHDSGFFLWYIGNKRIYTNEEVNLFDFCETDTWPLLWVEDFMQRLKWETKSQRRIVCSGYCLQNGLVMGWGRSKCDAETHSMVALVPRITI